MNEIRNEVANPNEVTKLTFRKMLAKKEFWSYLAISFVGWLLLARLVMPLMGMIFPR